jgi:hypothetical protein
MAKNNGQHTSAQESWHPARLIPVAGIRGQEEQEKRATSALLAVMRAVPEFGHALLGALGAPRGRIETFAEVQLKDANGKLSIPDGVIVVERGKTRWRALVEVKTGDADLTSEQVNRYLDMAREHNFDSLVTISNQITARPGELPFQVDRRKVRSVGAWHLPWWRILTEAIMQHRFRGVSDPDQAWILGELIAYLDHEKSGASGFEDMGSGWVAVRDGARQGTLRAANKEVRLVAQRWEQLLDYIALGLSQDLGREVAPVRPRGQLADARIDGLVQSLAGGALAGGLRVPDAVGTISVVANLQAQQVTTSVSIEAPREGRAQARVNWLLRQLGDAPAELRVESAFAGTRETAALLLAEAREYPQRLLSSTDPKREPRSFTLALTRKMGLNRGKGQGSFVLETRRQVVDFYGEIVQDLKAWQARAPQLPEPPAVVPDEPQPEPPPFVAVDEREPTEGITPFEDSSGY